MVESKEEQFAKLVVGVDNKASCEIGDYTFKFHFPGVRDGLQIQMVAKNLRKELVKDDDDNIRIQTIILATFEVLCEEIIKKNGDKLEILTIKDNSGNIVRKQKFLEFVDSLAISNVWGRIIYPLYDNYVKFVNDILLKEDEIKN